jgi:hypothetical protein
VTCQPAAILAYLVVAATLRAGEQPKSRREVLADWCRSTRR